MLIARIHQRRSDAGIVRRVSPGRADRQVPLRLHNIRDPAGFKAPTTATQAARVVRSALSPLQSKTARSGLIKLGHVSLPEWLGVGRGWPTIRLQLGFQIENPALLSITNERAKGGLIFSLAVVTPLRLRDQRCS